MSEEQDKDIGISSERISDIRGTPSTFVEEVIGVEPFDYQRDILDCGNDRIAFVSGRQVGKSRTCAWIALHHALTNKHNHVLITAPTQRQSMEIFDQVKREMDESNIPSELWGTDRETRTVIEFQNGSRILCLPSGDDGSNIRTYTAHLIIADEAAFIPEPVFYQALIPMMATTNGKMVLAGTPYGNSGFMYDAFHNNLEEEYFTKQVASYESPLVDDTFIEIQKQQLNSTDFKQEILGKFSSDEVVFFPEDVIDAITVDDPIDKETKDCYLGADIARHGADRSVYVLIDGDGHVFRIEEDEDNNLAEAIGHIKYLDDMFNFHKIMIDETSLGGGVVDILKDDITGNRVEGVTFSWKSKQDMYNQVLSMMENGRVTLPDHPRLQRELLDLERKFTQSGRMKIHAPEGAHDDYCDAVILAIIAHDKHGVERMSGPISFN